MAAYDQFVHINGSNKRIVDRTGALRAVILKSTDCGKSGIAVKTLGGELVGEAFNYYTDNDHIVRKLSNDVQERARTNHPAAYVINSRNVSDHLAPQFAY